jgi:hypothetical protein
LIHLLDANVVIDFDHAKCLQALVQQTVVRLCVVEQVHDELCIPKPKDVTHRVSEKSRVARLLGRWLSAPIEILPGTQAERVMRHLLRRKTSSHSGRDLGEAASIAAASVDRELCFVTDDAGAARLALGELFESGERVQRLAPFVRALHARRAIDRDVVKQLGSLPKLRGDQPSWWEGWVAAI